MKYFLLVFCFSFLCSCGSSTYYLVRHAEKVDESRDPPLSEPGLARANALKDSLMGAGIDQLYATSYLRTQQTVQPLAQVLGKEVTIYDAGKTYEFVQEIKKTDNLNLVIAGHSNTIPEMILYLTGDTVQIGHDDYNQLFLVKKRGSVFSDKYVLIEKKYGQ